MQFLTSISWYLALPVLFNSTAVLAAVCPPTIAAFAPVLFLPPTEISSDVDRPDAESPFVSPDGKYFATFTIEGEVTLWDATTATQLVTFNRGRQAVDSSAFDSEAKLFRAVFFDGWVRSWDFSGKMTSEFRLASSWLPSVDFSPDGKLLLEKIRLGDARRLDRATADRLMASPVERADLVDFARAARQAVEDGVTDRTPTDLRILNATNGALITRLKRHDGRVRDVAFSGDSTWIATATREGKTRVENTLDGSVVFETDFKTKVDIALSPDRRFLSVNSKEFSSLIRLADRYPVIATSRPMVFDFIPSTDFELVEHSHGNVARSLHVNGTRLDVTGVFKSPTLKIVSSTVSPDGKRLALEFDDRTLVIFDLQTKLALAQLTGVEDLPGPSGGQFTANGLSYIRVNLEGALQYWDLSQLPVDAPLHQVTADEKKAQIVSRASGAVLTTVIEELK